VLIFGESTPTCAGAGAFEGGRLRADLMFPPEDEGGTFDGLLGGAVGEVLDGDGTSIGDEDGMGGGSAAGIGGRDGIVCAGFSSTKKIYIKLLFG